MPRNLHLTANEAEIHGPLRYIVRSAHKWGGNGTVPDFNKIRRVLTTKHPEVIAKAFGGDPNRAAAWIKDAWEKYYGRALKGKGGVGPTYWRGKGKGGSTEDDATMSHPFDQDESELFMADGEEDVELDGENEVWAPVCRTGTWQRSPLPGGKPLKITRERLEKWVRNFGDGAWENVTLPLTHRDQTHENTGFVNALEVRPDPKRAGQFKLWAKHHFTEPDILAKVRRGTIRGRSVGVAVNGLTRTSDGRHFDEVLKHVCLTNHPWLDGLGEDEPLAAAWEPEPDDADFEQLADLLAGTDQDEDVALALAVADLIRDGEHELAAELLALEGTPRDPDADEDAAGEDDPEGPGGGAPVVLGHLEAERTVGQMSAGEFFIPHSLIGKESGIDANMAQDPGDLPDMPPGVHHVEGDHPKLKAHKLVTEVASGRQSGMPNGSKVTPFVPYITNASPDADSDVTGLLGQDGDGDDAAKHRFAGPKGAKCKVCGKSFAAGNHYGAEDMNAELQLGWLEDAGVKRSDLDPSDFLIPSTRTLPYKIHGKVNAKGWRAAWNVVNGGHGYTPPSGTSVEALKKKLLASKPQGVDVQMAYVPGPPVLRLRLDMTRTPSPELHAALRRRGLVDADA